MSKIPLDQDFTIICEEILSHQKSNEEWAEIESDDMFQRGKYSGGFEAGEKAFCFSYYESPEKEFWFQFLKRIC